MRAHTKKRLDPYAGALVLAGILVDDLCETGALTEDALDEIETLFPYISHLAMGNVRHVAGKIVTLKTSETFSELYSAFEDLLVSGEVTGDTLRELRQIRPIISDLIGERETEAVAR